MVSFSSRKVACTVLLLGLGYCSMFHWHGGWSTCVIKIANTHTHSHTGQSHAANGSNKTVMVSVLSMVSLFCGGQFRGKSLHKLFMGQSNYDSQ